ncbi:hypothetical protein EJ110_NYTH42085 [Nymphaea thermarum]|nr:hypothetical protein EJ110_NYTH42085 [Nymphaea thermarum]
MQDAVHAIMISGTGLAPVPVGFSYWVLRSGFSYWVPPTKKATEAAVSMADLVGKLTNPMTDEESLLLTTSKRWPSCSYFVEGAPPEETLAFMIKFRMNPI